MRQETACVKYTAADLKTPALNEMPPVVPLIYCGYAGKRATSELSYNCVLSHEGERAKLGRAKLAGPRIPRTKDKKASQGADINGARSHVLQGATQRPISREAA